MKKNLNLIRIISPSASILPYSIVVIYTILATWLAYHHGLCCADDGSFAVVSKNIANGLGYVLTLNYSSLPYTAQAFPPALGLGPAPILFVAAFVRILGNLPWVPSVASVLLNSVFLATLARGLSRITDPVRSTIILVAFLISAVLINYANAGYWFTQFGEVPAILATTSAYVWWCDPNRSASGALAAGVLLALGFLTKELNAIYLVPIGLLAVYEGFSKRKTRHISALVIGASVPVIFFETYKWISLGSLAAYLESWRQHISFIALQNSRQGNADIFGIVKERATLFKHQFAVPMWFVLVATGIAGLLPKSSASVRVLSGLIIAAIYLHFSYWLFKSPGWTRYIYEALVLFSLLSALLMATQTNLGLAAIPALLIVVVAARHKNELSDPNVQLDGQLQQTWVIPTMNADRRVLDYLLSHSPDRPVYVQWWAQVPNLEYLSPRPLLFQHWRFHSPNETGPYLLVTNDRLMYTGDASFFELLKQCGEPALSAPPYRVYRCSGN
ncbi:Dolichyl-phosphate-mannose-protein mannosyltransferase [Caballeronia arationis]|uniref:Dolichyl-phosphate-mannose-protein mannosyltransferase n=1 Tax=Caballeronia arationis TaxID=1777142 RepID=A0A7Z7IA01_9BURK|nr:hypothetical protein [Caballeronia arationis]SOE82082.1 Dolichyl-phosphate-mannose-protein mannosyltransferase [Caballeronia arationis]